MEVLGGDILYGSLDDFYKKFKSLIDGTKEASQDNSKKTLAVMRGIVAALFVMFVLSLTGLVFGAVQAHRESTFWANPEIFADSSAPEVSVNNFSDITLTHPRNPADTLTGSFALHDGFLFLRGEGGMYSRLMGDIVFIPGAAGLAALAEDRLIVPGVIPSFIVGHSRAGNGSHIYFTDAAAGNAIFRASTAGNDLTQITEGAALNLAVVDDFLFYTSVYQNHSLVRYDIVTGEHRIIRNTPVHAVYSGGSHLFFIADNETGGGTTLYSWNLAEERLLRIATDAAGNLRSFNGTLFYLSDTGRVRSITFDGRPLETHSPRNVRSFDVSFQWLVFSEEGVHVPRLHNMDNGRTATVTSEEWVSYVWLYDGVIYAIDNVNPLRVHSFSFPTIPMVL
jgi:hypothetical protein